jgi:hypothetical protein
MVAAKLCLMLVCLLVFLSLCAVMPLTFLNQLTDLLSPLLRVVNNFTFSL